MKDTSQVDSEQVEAQRAQKAVFANIRHRKESDSIGKDRQKSNQSRQQREN